MSIILGTAGHIDHGKTSLVRALTGIDCDRLSEEKRRGITIELGFAWASLPDGGRLGIVDVPGHERFVRNMVAGAAGVDFVMLVIAADEGVMPQTREHLEICSLLGIRQGFVALTKTDMVEPDWLELVSEDIRNFLKGSFLENAPFFPVSAITGQGLDALKAHIESCAAQLPPRHDCGLFRLPVDRVFSMKGHGTVVTGTVISGSLEQGAELHCMPTGKPCRVRGLQRHEQPAQRVETGQRCAVNVQNLDVADFERGFVLARPGTLFPSRRWLVRLSCLPSAPRPLRQRVEIHFHHGTRECLARLHFRDRDKLAPGETALAELRFREELTGVTGDHCVLRACSPLRTVAGGILTCPLPPVLRRKDEAKADKLRLLGEIHPLREHCLATPGPANYAALLATLLEIYGTEGLDEAHLRVLSGLTGAAMQGGLSLLGSQGKALCVDRENRQWISRVAFESLEQCCLSRAAELHRKEPLRSAFPGNALTAGLGRNLTPRLVQKVLDHLCKAGKLVQDGEGLRLAEHRIVLTGNQAGLKQQLLAAHQEGGASPPNIKDVLEALQISPKEASPILRLLCKEGALVKIHEGLYYDGAALEHILTQVRQWFCTHDNLDVGGLREILGLSRKYLIALLEYMDNAQITIRVGDQRRWRGR